MWGAFCDTICRCAKFSDSSFTFLANSNFNAYFKRLYSQYHEHDHLQHFVSNSVWQRIGLVSCNRFYLYWWSFILANVKKITQFVSHYLRGFDETSRRLIRSNGTRQRLDEAALRCVSFATTTPHITGSNRARLESSEKCREPSRLNGEW